MCEFLCLGLKPTHDTESDILNERDDEISPSTPIKHEDVQTEPKQSIDVPHEENTPNFSVTEQPVTLLNKKKRKGRPPGI